MGAVAVAGFFVFGLLVGSFLNVCISRLPRRESVVWPASHCTKCGRNLSWFENIPVASWLVLRGRCRTCHEPIGLTYPVVELVTGVTFAGGYAIYGLTPLLAVRLLFASAMIVLFVIDLRHQILPNVITLPGIVVGLVCSVMLPPGWLASLIGAIAGGGILFAFAEIYYRIRKVEGLGMGDVKMLAMIGAFLGWQLTFVTLLLASFSGSVIGAALIATGRGRKKTPLPFGTFLAVGALIAAVSGEALLTWYLSLYP